MSVEGQPAAHLQPTVSDEPADLPLSAKAERFELQKNDSRTGESTSSPEILPKSHSLDRRRLTLGSSWIGI